MTCVSTLQHDFEVFSIDTATGLRLSSPRQAKSKQRLVIVSGRSNSTVTPGEACHISLMWCIAHSQIITHI